MYHWEGKSAREIADLMLECTGNALLSNDFDLMARCIHLPHVMGTPDVQTVLRTREDVREVFDRVVEDYRNKNVTDIIRFSDAAEFHGPDIIETSHVSHLMSGNQRVFDPIPTLSVLKLIDGRWQAISSQYAVEKSVAIGRALQFYAPFDEEQKAPALTQKGT